MQTKILNIKSDTDIALNAAIQELTKGGILCFPTETVYGVGCMMNNDTAIKSIFNLKGRSFGKPLSAHIGKLEDVEDICLNIPDSFYILAEKFLPGPLAIILKKKSTISNRMTSGMNTIGIRYPAHDFLQRLINEINCPLAGTSANRSGEPFATNGDMAYDYFNQKVPLILDDGTTEHSQESTVITLAEGKPKCFREGVIKISQLESLLSVKFQ